MTPVVIWALVGLVSTMLLGVWRALELRAYRRRTEGTEWVVVIDSKRLTPGCSVRVGRRVGRVLVVEGQRVLLEWRRS